MRRIQRKILTPPANKLVLIEDSKRTVKKKESPWLSKNYGIKNGVTFLTNDDKLVLKRGKRTLALEKDKSSSRSIKVLRRSHGQVKDPEKNDEKLHLPSVKINKTL